MKSLGKVFILGDSYSTFEGAIPDGFEAYYGSNVEKNTDVRRVEQTWWHRVLENTGSDLVLNSSYSGTTIGDTGYSGVDCSKTHSFNARMNRLISQGFFDKTDIDTFFIFGGTNDFWSGAPIGELDFGDKRNYDRLPTLPAFCKLVETVKEHCPKARIITLINYGFKPEITQGLIEGSKHYGIEYVLLCDMDKIDAHPTALGMEQISKDVLEKL